MSGDAHDGLGLGKLGDFDLSAMLEPAEAKFLEIEIGRIQEDEENPRNSFDPATLEELAETIRARGVIMPISVRPDPDREGEYIVNHGHRRLRAAKMAGLAAIPAVIDQTFRDEDRIIENIQCDNLDMHDVAQFIAKKLGEGLKQKEVAKIIGKSTAYVSHHVQLLELPMHTDSAVKQGRLTDLTTIADLAKAERTFPDSVEMFLAGGREVTRTAVRKFREGLGAGATTASGGHDGGSVGKEPSGKVEEKRAEKNVADPVDTAEKGERYVPPMTGLPQVARQTADNSPSGGFATKNSSGIAAGTNPAGQGMVSWWRWTDGREFCCWVSGREGKRSSGSNGKTGKRRKARCRWGRWGLWRWWGGRGMFVRGN